MACSRISAAPSASTPPSSPRLVRVGSTPREGVGRRIERGEQAQEDEQLAQRHEHHPGGAQRAGRGGLAGQRRPQRPGRPARSSRPPASTASTTAATPVAARRARRDGGQRDGAEHRGQPRPPPHADVVAAHAGIPRVSSRAWPPTGRRRSQRRPRPRATDWSARAIATRHPAARSSVGRVVPLLGEGGPRGRGQGPRTRRRCPRRPSCPTSARIARSVVGPDGADELDDVVGADRAQQADDRPVTGGPAQQVDAGGQAAHAGRHHGGQPVQQVIGPQPRPTGGGGELAGIGDGAQLGPAAGQRRPDARRRLDQPLQAVRRRASRPRAGPVRGPACRGGEEVGLGAGVQQDGRLCPPRPLLQTDHELAGAGGRPPVHLPQVVAVAVLARADVVLAVHGDRSPGALAATAVAGGQPAGTERPDAGDDDQQCGVGADGAAFDQPERVDQAEAQRPEHVPAAAHPAHPVPEGCSRRRAARR